MCIVAKALVFAAAVLSVASAASASEYPCKDPLSSKSLSEAVDAALVSLHGQSGWLHNLRQSTGYTHPIEVTSCTPKIAMWSWPGKADADGLLANVLETGQLRVAGVQWKKGGAADYKTDPSAPTGFWPEYMNGIASAMSSHYGKSIAVKRIYYDNSDLVNEAVASGSVDMSEPYYYLGGFHDSKPRIEALHTSCITIATSSAFSSLKASGISSMDKLYDKIVLGPNRKVGFIGAGNYDAVSHVLPANVEPVYITDASALDASVDNGTLLAQYISEGSASDDAQRSVYETGVISPRVALFRQDDTTKCLSNAAFQAGCSETASPSASIFAVLIILACVLFAMTCLLGMLIWKERSGKPIFMVPLKDHSSGGQAIGAHI